MNFLVGDIGGTKTVLAVFKQLGDGLKEVRSQKFVSGEFPSLETIIQKFLNGVGERIDRACFGIAGPVIDEVVHATNLPWVISAEKISREFSIKRVFLINDLRANAYGLRLLKEEDFFLLNEGKPQPRKNQALISAGTGLGESAIFFDGKEHVPCCSEGGHADFSPRNELEIDLLRFLQKKYGRVSMERVLSGSGLVNLYKFLIASGSEAETSIEKEAMKNEDPAKVISELALFKKSKACERALEWFCSIYGGEAGNFALKILALGGVYIGGGIAPKILNALKESHFMDAFVDKGRFKPLLSDIPVYIVLEESTALLGSAYYCSNPSSL